MNGSVAALRKKCSADVSVGACRWCVLDALRFGLRFEMKKSVELSESESGIVRGGKRDENGEIILSRLGVGSLQSRCPVSPSRSPASRSTPAARSVLSAR